MSHKMIASITIPLNRNKIVLIKLVRWLGWETDKPVEERSPFYSLRYAKDYVEAAIEKAVANVIHLAIPTHRTEEEIKECIEKYNNKRWMFLEGIIFQLDLPSISIDEFEKEL